MTINDLVFPLTPDSISYILWRMEHLKREVVHCFATYRTEKGTDRTVQGTFMGVEKDKIVLRYNGRNNRVPVDRCFRMTYDIAAQGGEVPPELERRHAERLY